MRKIYYNSKNINLDEGLFFGRGVFETIHVLKKPILLEYHIERLKDGMEKIGLKPLREENNLLDFIENIKKEDIGLKILVTPSNIIITERPIPYTDEDYKRGSRLTFSSVIRNSTSVLTYIKSLSYAENMIEREKGKEKGFNDVIFLNENKFITETSCSNIFIIKNKKIFTPKIKDGLLSGIIRRWIIENFNVTEKSIKEDEILEADEVFITNSLMGIMPVYNIDKKVFKSREWADLITEKYEKMKVEENRW